MRRADRGGQGGRVVAYTGWEMELSLRIGRCWNGA
jgi:hypothetical protein